MSAHGVLIALVMIVPEARVFQRPAVLPVIDQGDAAFRRASDQRFQRSEPPADLRGFAVDARLVRARMVHDRAVILFRAAPPFAELEILHAVRPVRDGLHALQHQHAGLAQAVDGLPVDRAGRGLHHHEGLLPAGAAHQVMIESRIHQHARVPLIARPPGIIVPGGHVQRAAQVEVVDAFIGRHHIGRTGHVRRDRLQRRDFPLVKVPELVGRETPPVERERRVIALSDGRRAFHRVKRGIEVAPERVPPGLIEFVDRAVPLFEPGAEALLAQRTVALAAVFVGYMPQSQRGMRLVTLRQRRIDGADLFAVHRRGQAMVVPGAVQFPRPVRAHAQHLRVLFRHPLRLRAAGCGKHRFHPVGREQVHDLVQEAEVILPFAWLEHSPGEDAHRQRIDARRLGQLHVARPDFFLHVPPLLGIIVSSVQQVWEILHNGWILHVRASLFRYPGRRPVVYSGIIP